METYAFPTLEGAPVTAKGSSPAERAAEIVAQARARAAAVSAEAEALGREAGYAAGLEEGRERVEAATAALADVAHRLAVAMDERGERLERQAAELGLSLAHKILGVALEVRPELVVEVVAGALRGQLERGRVVVEVSPDDLELVTGALEGVSDTASGLGRVDIVSDRRVTRGGCVVHTEDAEVDCTVAAQLDRAAEIVRDAMSAA
jgi:flagellar assembly protein FliH